MSGRGTHHRQRDHFGIDIDSNIQLSGATASYSSGDNLHDVIEDLDSRTTTPGTFDFPSATSPAQTAEGRAIWDSDDDKLTIGTGAARKTLVNEGAATTSGLTMATARLLGRTTASTGAIEEISVGTGLSLTAGSLTATASGTLTVAVAFTIDGGGVAITTGIKGDLEIPFSWSDIVSARIFSDVSTSSVVDIWKDTYANFPPVVGDSITASAKPTLTTASKNQDTTLTGWMKTGTAGDILRFNVDSNNNATRLLVSLAIVRAL